MSVSRGDIVLVDYPFSDRTGSKVRPALVVQSDALNHRITDTILASISRATHRASATQLFIDISTPEAGGIGLRQNSMIQCENLLTYDQRLVITKIGQLSAPLLDRVQECLENGARFALRELKNIEILGRRSPGLRPARKGWTFGPVGKTGVGGAHQGGGPLLGAGGLCETPAACDDLSRPDRPSPGSFGASACRSRKTGGFPAY